VTQNIDIIDSYDVEYILILAGDHIYKMDYEHDAAQHVESGADVTVGCLTCRAMEATAFGVMDVDANDRITEFPGKARRSARHAGRSGPRAGLDGHLRLQLEGSCATCCGRRCRQPRFQPRFRP
jgi:ADP-glucose pyrophosphorylase